jgi:hypothetical protein
MDAHVAAAGSADEAPQSTPSPGSMRHRQHIARQKSATRAAVWGVGEKVGERDKHQNTESQGTKAGGTHLSR